MYEALVLSGCFYNILKMYGCVYELYNQLQNLTHIYTTSGGALIGLVLALKMDKDVVLDYMHQRPWIKLLQIKNLSFSKKGIFERSIFKEIIEPLLLSVNLSSDITLKELFEKTGMHFKLTGTKFSDLSLVELDHTTYPNMTVIDAITITCSIPLVFEPLYYKGDYYFDGGLCCHYPIQISLKNHKKENILGISTKSSSTDSIINEDASSFDFLVQFNAKLIKHIIKEKNKEQTGEIDIIIDTEGIQHDVFYEISKNKKMRMDYINIGRALGKQYLSRLNHQTKDACYLE